MLASWKGLKVLRFTSHPFLYLGFFIAWMAPYMGPGTGGHDIFLALWRGFRLSMQTAGALTLVSFVRAAASFLEAPCWGRRYRVARTACCSRRSPFSLSRASRFTASSREQWSAATTGGNGDICALFITMVQQYLICPCASPAGTPVATVLWRGLRAFLGCTWLEDFLDGLRLPATLRWLGRLAFLYLTYIRHCCSGILQRLQPGTTNGGQLGERRRHEGLSMRPSSTMCRPSTAPTI